ncbi:uncharacterized protein LOC143361561 [Halictus rubicundus]|uniref:uncharacterized protein LOC143361561 n=1 Tax=Halictus rubicundus TaxID=77578 RepID=UPI00403700E8
MNARVTMGRQSTHVNPTQYVRRDRGECFKALRIGPLINATQLASTVHGTPWNMENRHAVFQVERLGNGRIASKQREIRSQESSTYIPPGLDSLHAIVRTLLFTVYKTNLHVWNTQLYNAIKRTSLYSVEIS